MIDCHIIWKHFTGRKSSTIVNVLNMRIIKHVGLTFNLDLTLKRYILVMNITRDLSLWLILHVLVLLLLKLYLLRLVLIYMGIDDNHFMMLK